jgi:hypothetical protein
MKAANAPLISVITVTVPRRRPYRWIGTVSAEPREAALFCRDLI